MSIEIVNLILFVSFLDWETIYGLGEFPGYNSRKFFFKRFGHDRDVFRFILLNYNFLVWLSFLMVKKMYYNLTT